MTTSNTGRIQESISILTDLGLPRAQRNERSALCLLALINLTPEKSWVDAESRLIGISPIMDWAQENYGKKWAPNTRETVRRQTMHQFVQAGIALYNPDKLDRPTNSPHAVYQIEPNCLAVLRTFGTPEYRNLLEVYLTKRPTLAVRYSKQREMKMVPLSAEGQDIRLSPGKHSELISAIWEQFGPRFVPGGKLIYAGDTGFKWGFFDQERLASLGVIVDNHGKMPDVVIYYPEKHWLILVEAVTSHGPVDAKRHQELSELFKNSNAGLVFVSAFPNRRIFKKYAETISWETEVWIADNPGHLIHYNGARFLGPYSSK
jgi:hypothetical protein